jgi:hypothetical protein
VQQAEGDVAAAAEPAAATTAHAARVPIDLEVLRQQLTIWEKALEEKST